MLIAFFRLISAGVAIDLKDTPFRKNRFIFAAW